MGRRGPAKQPTKLRLMRGDPSKVGKNKKEAQPASGCQPPEFVTGDALAIWNQIAPVLLSAHMITKADAYALGRYCKNLALYITASAAAEKNKGLQQNRFGDAAPSAEAKLMLQLDGQLLRMEQQFGMTPSARAGITIAPDKDSDPLGEFLKKA